MSLLVVIGRPKISPHRSRLPPEIAKELQSTRHFFTGTFTIPLAECGIRAYPPIWMEEREREVVHHFVVMAVEVASSLLVPLDPDPKAIHAQVKVRANSALYPHYVADVPLAVVAMVLRSAHRFKPRREQRSEFQIFFSWLAQCVTQLITETYGSMIRVIDSMIRVID
jgi:hypothetical protein